MRRGREVGKEEKKKRGVEKRMERRSGRREWKATEQGQIAYRKKRDYGGRLSIYEGGIDEAIISV